MKFAIVRASEVFQANRGSPCQNAQLIGKDRWGDDLWAVEIDTLEDLLALKAEVAHSLILGSADKDVWDLDIKHSILIYDDYIE